MVRPIGQADQIAAIIRQQLQLATSAPRTAKRPAATRPTGKRTPDPDSRLAGLISRRLLAIDPADPDRGRKAFQAFIEGVLIARFGESAINDPAFQQLAEDVLAAIGSDPELAPWVDQATSSLLAS